MLIETLDIDLDEKYECVFIHQERGGETEMVAVHSVREARELIRILEDFTMLKGE